MPTRFAVVAVLVCGIAPLALAQDGTGPTAVAPESSNASDLPPPVPPPPVETPPPLETPPPPPGYAATAPGTQGTEPGVIPPLSRSESDRRGSDRRRVNVWLGLGGGDAFCGNEDPDSPCAVDGAFAGALGGDYRLHPNFGIGLEISGWSFSVSDHWLGQLSGEQKSAEIGASSLSIIGRWYWFDRGIVDPYLQFGVGLGGMEASVTNNADQTYTYSASGSMWNLGVGGDFHVTPWFKLGPQLLAALLVGNNICETVGTDGDSVCRDARKDDKGDKEGRALAWRLMIIGTVMLGER